MKKLLFGLLATVLLTINSYGQNIDDYNKQFNEFKEQQKLKSDAIIIKSDQNKPLNLSKYLNQSGLQNEQINTITHIQIDTKSSLGILETYSVQYSKDNYSKYLIIIEDSKMSENYILVNAMFNFKDDSVSVIEVLRGKSRWSECFGNCVDAGLSAHSTIGRAIISLGVAAGFGCAPCGAAAATYTGVILLGCAGGCNK